MKRYIIAAAVGAVLALAPARDLVAQPWQAGLPGNDFVSFAVRFGTVAPTTTLQDGAKFDGGLAGGVSFTYWPIRYLGVRLNYELAKTEGNKLVDPATGGIQSSASMEDPTVSFFGSELNFRYPVRTSSMVYSPYAGGGAGIKQYDWSLNTTGIERDLVFAWNLTGGLEVRPVRSPWVSVVLEAKRHTSRYKWHAMFWDEPTFNDMLFTVGISLNR